MELLPCPFCGGKAEIDRYGTRRVSTIYRCTNCACLLETGEEWDHGKRWNQRYLTTEEQKIMHEALRQSVTIVAKGERK